MALPHIQMTGTVVDETPTLRYTQSGAPVAQFRIACNKRVQDPATKEWRDGDVCFLSVELWRDKAENVAETLRRGLVVQVTGDLRQRSFETAEGERRQVYEVVNANVAVDLGNQVAEVTKKRRPAGAAPAAPAAAAPAPAPPRSPRRPRRLRSSSRRSDPLPTGSPAPSPLGCGRTAVSQPVADGPEGGPPREVDEAPRSETTRRSHPLKITAQSATMRATQPPTAATAATTPAATEPAATAASSPLVRASPAPPLRMSASLRVHSLSISMPMPVVNVAQCGRMRGRQSATKP